VAELLEGRVYRAGALTALVAGGLLFGAAPSLATWSTPRTVNSLGRPALATDGRGDVALAWVGAVRRCSHSRCIYGGPVQVAFGRSTGPLVTHTVWRHANAGAYGVTVVLDARGELTVAWVDAHPNIDGQRTVRAAFRTPAGRWSAVQAVGHSNRLNPLLPVDYVDPRLAVAPDRGVLLTWNAGEVFAPRGRLGQAWRRPGHRFGPTAEYRLNGAGMGDQTPVFDSGGAAHVYGVVSYTPPRQKPSRSNAVMLSTAAHSHRFGAPVVVAPSGGALVMSFSAAGQAIAAWLNPAGQLQPPASPYARVMLHGALGAPVALPSEGTKAVTAVAANGGGGSVGWVPEPVSAAPDSVMVATADASGRFSPPSVQADRLAPAARDGAGDILLREPDIFSGSRSLGTPFASPFAVQPATGGALQPSPVPQSPFGQTGQAAVFATAEPVGRGAALAWPLTWPSGSKVAIATWRP
jgi:hypothetical protein